MWCLRVNLFLWVQIFNDVEIQPQTSRSVFRISLAPTAINIFTSAASDIPDGVKFAICKVRLCPRMICRTNYTRDDKSIRAKRGQLPHIIVFPRSQCLTNTEAMSFFKDSDCSLFPNLYVKKFARIEFFGSLESNANLGEIRSKHEMK
jgi:hypothetical protein